MDVENRQKLQGIEARGTLSQTNICRSEELIGNASHISPSFDRLKEIFFRDFVTFNQKTLSECRRK